MAEYGKSSGGGNACCRPQPHQRSPENSALAAPSAEATPVAAEAVLVALAVATALAPVPVAVVAAATPVLAPATEAVPITTALIPCLLYTSPSPRD